MQNFGGRGHKIHKTKYNQMVFKKQAQAIH
jgi:hypothetical protein